MSLLAEEQLSFETGVAVDEQLVWSAHFNSQTKETEMARTASGRTTPGTTDWQQYHTGNGIFVDVDTSSADFSNKVVYITSLGGSTHHWATTGGSSVYPTPPDGPNIPSGDPNIPSGRGFRIHIRWVDDGPLTPETANGFGWHINWIGMEIGSYKL